MKAFFNGKESNSFSAILGADADVNILLLDDDGTPVSLASPAVTTVEFFLTSARSATAADTITVTPGAGAAAGFGSFKIEDTEATLSRQTYYVWVKWKSDSGTGVGTTVKICTSASTLLVR